MSSILAAKEVLLASASPSTASTASTPMPATPPASKTLTTSHVLSVIHKTALSKAEADAVMEESLAAW